MKKFLVLITTCLLLMVQPAYSADLQTAKSKGLVGETPSGYLQAVKPATPEIKALLKNINSKRKQKYQEIAARNNTPLKTVEQLAGDKAMKKSKPGSYIKQGGSWKKK